jgi:hypothetical protein
MHTVTRSAVLLVLLALVLSATPARAETISCTAITSVPFVITIEGVYCLTGDLITAMPSGNAIDILTNNVVLDLNGFKLGDLGAGPGTQAVGINGRNRKNITIKNGTIRGFLLGIILSDSGPSQGHLVEDIRADQNTWEGINVQGTGNIVRNNQVVATGGSTVIGTANAIGIAVFGAGPRVLNNDVIKTVKQGTGVATGITLFGTDVLAVNNRITEADKGIDHSSFGVSTGKYRDNVTSGVTTPYTGGTDIGNNN